MGCQRVQLFLAPELRHALIDYMAQMGLDSEYAALSFFVEGAYRKGKLSRKDYEFYLCRYSVKIVQEEVKPLSVEEQRRKQEFDEKVRYWASVLVQWESHKDNLVWVERIVNYAANYKDVISDAKKVIELGEIILNSHVLMGSKSQQATSVFGDVLG